MFKIEYRILPASFDDIESITEEELRYTFLLGDVVFRYADTTIDMAWGWIPLLDFSLNLMQICNSLKLKQDCFEYFEFTESEETLKFERLNNELRILPSFGVHTISMRFDDFEKEVQVFYRGIKNFIKENTSQNVYLKIFAKLPS